MRKTTKIKVAKQICNEYATDKYRIDDCCVAYGISYSTFHNWVYGQGPDDKGKIEEIEEIFKKADLKRIQSKKIKIKEKAMSSLERLIEGFDYEEKHTTMKVDNEGNAKPAEVKSIKKKILPNPTAVIYALNNTTSGEFTNMHEIKGELTIDPFIQMQKRIAEKRKRNNEEKS